MFTIAAGKTHTGVALDNPVLKTEGRVTLIDGLLAAAVLLGGWAAPREGDRNRGHVGD
jgi:hypothetical protein